LHAFRNTTNVLLNNEVIFLIGWFVGVNFIDVL